MTILLSTVLELMLTQYRMISKLELTVKVKVIEGHIVELNKVEKDQQ